MRKTLDIEIDGHPVVLSRRKGTRSLKLSIKSDGQILLSAPRLVSEKVAVGFLLSKKSWLQKHLKPVSAIQNLARVGKAWRVKIAVDDNFKDTVRLNGLDVLVQVKNEDSAASSEIRAKVQKSAEKSLKKQSDNLLPQRLAELSRQTGLKYKSTTTKKLKSRWGSCDQDNNIVLNIYLIQLDWELIDYVIIHELAHTMHKNHQSEFWSLVERFLPDAKARRKALKSHSTQVELATTKL